MPYLNNKKSILETFANHPESAKKLWVEVGYEAVSNEVIQEAKKLGVSFRVISKDEFSKKFKDIKSHLCLERDEIAYADPDIFLGNVGLMKSPLVCAFDGIYDPQNLGNILRSAACFGVDAIVIPKDRSCGITQTVMSVSRGAVEHVTVVRVVNLARYLDALKEAGLFCYGLDEKATTPLWKSDLKGPTCLVFGAEEGLRRLTREKCDQLLRIPTEDAFPSLNVATSFAVAVGEARRQRA
jgi:23S rRNA (guanosine2251-2'-O)-methyltransferase